MYSLVLKSIQNFFKSNKATKTQIIFLCFFFSIVIAFFYAKAFAGYFQGDEWFYFTQFLPFTRQPYGIWEAFYKSIADSYDVSGGGHLDPIYNVVWFLHNQFFGLHFTPYMIGSLIVHSVNTILLFFVVRKVLKKDSYAFVAALFFGLSSIHQQAITWVMAYIPTLISVTFLLISLLFFLYWLEQKKQTLFILLSFLAFLAGLLTKESVVILFVIFPLLYVLSHPSRKEVTWRNVFFQLYAMLLIFYLPYRFLLPKFFLWLHYHGKNLPAAAKPLSIAFDLILFRLITYPLKMLTEVFVPYRWLLRRVEDLTPLAYPTYGAEKAVRGSNFLTFTQSAGSDMVIYLIALLLLAAIFGALIMTWRNIVLRNAILLGSAIVLLSSLPLLAIASYAPGWAYVTFFDSRHIYLASVGGAILFCLAIMSISDSITHLIILFLRKRYFWKQVKNYTSNLSIIFTVLLVILWTGIQYHFLQQDLAQLEQMGIQRKIVLQKILHDVPTIKKKAIILVTSNAGYYGFGPIPPFQTNLGQILSIFYYQNHSLPVDFMKSNFLTKNNLTGEGYTEYNGKGFGYFLDENNLIRYAAEYTISPDIIYAFAWNGGPYTMTNTTTSIRKKVREKQAILHTFADWKTFTDEQNTYSLRYPASMTLENDLAIDSAALLTDIVLSDSTSGMSMRIQVKTKPELIDLPTLLAFFQDSDGNVIGKNYSYRLIPMLTGDITTALYPTTGQYLKYFFSFPKQDRFFEITPTGDNLQRVIDEKTGTPVFNKQVEDIISTIKFTQ
jgi:hypothetical protein